MNPRQPAAEPDTSASFEGTPRSGHGSPNLERTTKKCGRGSVNWSDMMIGANDAKNPFQRIKEDQPRARRSINWSELLPTAVRPGSARRPDSARRPESARRPNSSRLPETAQFSSMRVPSVQTSRHFATSSLRDPADASIDKGPRGHVATKGRTSGSRLSIGQLNLLAKLGQENAAFTDLRFPVEDDVEFDRTLRRSSSTVEAMKPILKTELAFEEELKSPCISEIPVSDKEIPENNGTQSMSDETEAKKSASSPTSPPEGYPPLKQAVVVLIGIYLAIFLIALDRTILGTAIPQMTNEFGSFDDIGWYQSSYMLTLAAFQLFFGRFYTFYSPKWTYLLAIALFEIGSAICGAASSSTMFILGRAIAGIGSGGTFSGSLALLMNLLPLSQRAVAMGLIGACFGIASVVGPLLGGVFTTYSTWRWCFYINLPIGGITMLIVLIVVRVHAPMAARGRSFREKLLQLDPLGNVLFIVSVICLLLALQWGGTVYAWSNARIIVLIIVFAGTFAAWIASQMLRPKERVLVPRHIMRNRSILAGMWYAFFCNPAMVISALYLPVYFQAIKGVNAVESGIRIIPLVLGMVAMIIGSGILTGKIGYYTPFMIAGAIIAPIGTGLLTTITPETANGAIIAFQIITGIGIGLGVQQSMLAAQTVLPRRDGPQGSSLMILCQMLGGSIFASIAQSVLSQRLVKNVEALRITDLDAKAIVNTGATELKQMVPAASYPQFLEAYSHAITAALTVSVATACLSLLGALAMEWKSTKGNKAKMAAAKSEKTTNPPAAMVTTVTSEMTKTGGEPTVVLELDEMQRTSGLGETDRDRDTASLKSVQSQV